MFNPTVFTAKIANYPLPVSTVLSALLCLTLAPLVQAKSGHYANGYSAGNPINPANYCNTDIEAQTSHPKYQSTEQRAIDYMLTQLRVYQQPTSHSSHQQYFAYKAQAWLNYAYHEDSIKSESVAGKQAFQAGELILQALQNGEDEHLSVTTDIPSSSALMRPDLWATLVALKNSTSEDNENTIIAPREKIRLSHHVNWHLVKSP